MSISRIPEYPNPPSPDRLPAHSGLEWREFSNFPDLAAWCRPRVPEADRHRFAMGHGAAFVALVGFMRAHPGADLTLLAFSESVAADGTPQLASAYACVRGSGSGSGSGTGTGTVLPTSPGHALLLYQRRR